MPYQDAVPSSRYVMQFASGGCCWTAAGAAGEGPGIPAGFGKGAQESKSPAAATIVPRFRDDMGWAPFSG